MDTTREDAMIMPDRQQRQQARRQRAMHRQMRAQDAMPVFDRTAGPRGRLPGMRSAPARRRCHACGSAATNCVRHPSPGSPRRCQAHASSASPSVPSTTAMCLLHPSSGATNASTAACASRSWVCSRLIRPAGRVGLSPAPRPATPPTPSDPAAAAPDLARPSRSSTTTASTRCNSCPKARRSASVCCTWRDLGLMRGQIGARVPATRFLARRRSGRLAVPRWRLGACKRASVAASTRR